MNELQAAVEYLEHQLELVRRYAEGYPDKDNYTALADIYTTALDTTLSALRDALQRQPDPDTGLVPCGCGGVARVAVQYAYPDERRVFCERCGLTTIWLSAPMSVLQFHWNRAMGMLEVEG